MELITAAFIKFSKKLNVLQTVGMNIGSQQIDGQIQSVAHQENEHERNRTDDAAAPPWPPSY